MHQFTRRLLDSNIMGPDGQPSRVIKAFEIKGPWPNEDAARARVVIKCGRDSKGDLFGRVYLSNDYQRVGNLFQPWTLVDLRQENYRNLPKFKDFAQKLGFSAASVFAKFVLDKVYNAKTPIPAEPPPPQPRRGRVQNARQAHVQV